MKKWLEFAEKVRSGEHWEQLSNSSFHLNKGDKVFTIGSCFARNIEDLLTEHFSFPVLDYSHNDGEYSGQRPRGILNKFTPVCMLEELRWLYEIAVEGVSFEDATISRFFLLDHSGNLVIDLGLQEYHAVSEERFWQRRQHILDLYQTIFDVDCLILTLGLTEQWYFKGRVVQHAPCTKETLKQKEHFEFRNLEYEKVDVAIKEMIAIVNKINKKAKLVFTVSPVPLLNTFTKDNVVVANARSKATLLAAASSLCGKEGVDYFPSYEIVTVLGEQAFEKDLRHVKNTAVEIVSQEFLRAYC